MRGKRNSRKWKTPKNCTLKLYLLQMAIIKMTESRVAEDVEKLEPFCFVGRNVKQYSCFGNCWTVSQKAQ